MEFHFHFYCLFFVYLWHWKTDLNFVFRFSLSPHFEKGIWISVFVFRFSPYFEKRIWLSFFVFRFLITLKNGFEFQCVYLSANRFSMARENGIQMPFTFFVFAWHWKTDLNFAFCFAFSHHFEKRIIRWLNTVLAVCEYMSFAKSWQENHLYEHIRSVLAESRFI